MDIRRPYILQGIHGRFGTLPYWGGASLEDSFITWTMLRSCCLADGACAEYLVPGQPLQVVQV